MLDNSFNKKESPLVGMMGGGPGGTLGISGGAAAEKTYVDDVFSTFLYEGNNTTGRDIVNNIDLAGEGGLVWVKKTSGSENHVLIDTERGANNFIMSDSTNAANTSGGPVTDFNSNGFEVDNNGYVNGNSDDYVSWTFRKQPEFFDIVTYTGDSDINRTVSHSLDAVPGMIIVKKTSGSGGWYTWHRSLGGTGKALELNSTAGTDTNSNLFSTLPTATVFSPGDNSHTNQASQTYVAYLFAHDEQSFGTDSDEAIIKCGSFTTPSSGDFTVNLGFEPQWLMIKRTSSSGGSWAMRDVMRGWNLTGFERLFAESTSGQQNTSSSDYFPINSTGFGSQTDWLGANATYIYVAIRRSHKPPTAGTEVHQTLTYSGSGGTISRSTNILTDAFFTQRTSFDAPYAFDRMRGGSQYMGTVAGNTSEGTQNSAITIMGNNFLKMGSGATVNYSGKTYLLSLFKRAAGFFDVVGYEGTGSAQTVNHNLTVAPELLIVKRRSTATWWVYSSVTGNNAFLKLDSSVEAESGTNLWNTTTPGATTFSLGSNNNVVSDGSNYIAYLWASLAGVSKVGSYSGTGSNVNVDCGFTGGARFILIKRTDTEITGSSGTNWYIFDTTQGINAGNDPYMMLNLNDAQVTGTDYIDPLNAGFTVTSSAPAALNANGGTYLFLAIA